MKAVVTGAGGMLGRALVPALEAEGWSATPLTQADADITRIDELRRVFVMVKPDWVFHLAAFTRVNECELRRDFAFEVNGVGAGNAAQAAAEVGAAVLMISTDYVFGGAAAAGSRRPYREDDEPAPLNVYGESKRAGEAASRANNPRALVVRTAWLYGAGGRNFPDVILGKARRGEPLEVVDDQEGSPTWTEDLAPALVRLAKAGQFGTFHCTSTGSCTWYQFAQHLIEKEGLQVPVKKTRSPDHPPLRPAYSVLSNERYEKLTGHRMPGWRESADEYLESLPRPSRDSGAAKGAAREGT